MDLAGLILCGGTSSRMGEEKALLRGGGERLLDRVHQRMSAAASPVMFAPGHVGRLGTLPGPQVDDAPRDAGPLGGLVAGVRASPHELVAVVAVDMPWCSPTVFQIAAELWSGEDAIVPCDDYGAQVLHAVYARSAAIKLEGAWRDDHHGLRHLLGSLSVRYIDEAIWRPADPTGRFATNLNRPEDLVLWSSAP